MQAPTRPLALAPLAHPVFRRVWLAAMVSNIGTWMQNVGAAWLMVSLPHSPLLIALVQTATTLPAFIAAIPAGVIADRHDRRRVLLATQSWMLAAAALLAALTLAGRTGPWSLLALTFALGLGSTMNGPAWQATVPLLVPREHLPAAVALNSVQFNIARAAGPALGGLVVAVWGAGPAFALNAVSFLAVILVVLSWRGQHRPALHSTAREGLLPAALAGARFVRSSATMRIVLLRTGLFTFFGAALWALLPAVAAHGIGSGSGGYGLLLGCLGSGAVAAAISNARVRVFLSANQIALAGGLFFTAATLSLATFNSFSLLCVAMLVGGAGWMSVMSTLLITAQLSLPEWVRARGLSFYMFTFQSCLALGSWTWGMVAQQAGTPAALLIAAGGLALGLAAATRLRL